MTDQQTQTTEPVENTIPTHLHHWIGKLSVVSATGKQFPQNIIMMTEYAQLSSGNIVDMQTQAQLKFFHEHPDLRKDFKISAVIIDNISYLGHMTNEEFQSPPSINPNTKPVLM